MSFGSNLKSLRNKYKLTQETLAKELNITRDRLAKYEVDTNKPDHDMLKRISSYFNVSIDFLLDQTDEERQSHEQEDYDQECKRIGLSPDTYPLDSVTYQNRDYLYPTKAAVNELVKIHNIRIEIKNREVINDVFIVTARATLPEGRFEESIGAVSIIKLTGEALISAYIKAENMSKRRAILSICGWSESHELYPLIGDKVF